MILADPLSGSAPITLNGGKLKCHGIPKYSGTITAKSGEIDLEAKENALGDGTSTNQLIVQESGGPVKLVDTVGAATLANPITLAGGTLNIFNAKSNSNAGEKLPTLSLTGKITSTNDHVEIDANDPLDIVSLSNIVATLRRDGTGTTYPLKLGGTTEIDLVGLLPGAAHVTVAGKVNLENTFSGFGTLIVAGGTLSSFGAPNFEGTVTLQSGTMKAEASNALGTATLNVDASKGTPNLDLTGVTISSLNIGTLQGALTITGGSLTSATSPSVAANFNLTLRDNATVTLPSALKSSASLKVTVSGQGEVDLGGTLDPNITIIVAADAGLKELPDFHAAPGQIQFTGGHLITNG
ncbi:MAG TPA: hypothetical protein VKA15_04775 [Isosphaeraceae bacterium]|nr:hypothetical protein [Isosphaeraceae bacterium]